MAVLLQAPAIGAPPDNTARTPRPPAAARPSPSAQTAALIKLAADPAQAYLNAAGAIVTALALIPPLLAPLVHSTWFHLTALATPLFTTLRHSFGIGFLQLFSYSL